MNSLDFAINMELDGQEYYQQQAKNNIGNSLNTVFTMLAKDEGEHARILQNKAKSLGYELKDSDTLAEVKNVFNGIGDFKSEIKEVPKQVDLYREAFLFEKRSIDLYINLLSETTDEKEKKLFQFLIKQEKEHYEILDELVMLINRPDEWVESAEFGTREEY